LYTAFIRFSNLVRKKLNNSCKFFKNNIESNAYLGVFYFSFSPSVSLYL